MLAHLSSSVKNWDKMTGFEQVTVLRCTIADIDVRITQVFSAEIGNSCSMSTYLQELQCDQMGSCNIQESDSDKCLVILLGEMFSGI